MPYDKETGLYRYDYFEVSSINLAYADKGKDAIYDSGIDFYRRGYYIYTFTNRWGLAEFIADYERACKRFGKNPNKRIGGFYIKLMVRYLNGQN